MDRTLTNNKLFQHHCALLGTEQVSECTLLGMIIQSNVSRDVSNCRLYTWSQQSTSLLTK